MNKDKEISVEDLQDFVIEDEKKDDTEYEITTTDDVLNVDFGSDQDINIEEAYEFISLSNKPKETKELVEQREADNIIRDTAENLLNMDYVEMMNKEHDNLRNMIKRYDANSDLVKGMEESDKDKVYGIAEYLFNEYQKKLNDMDFMFGLTQDEWRFMLDVVRNKIEYDQNEVFQMKEVIDGYLDSAEEVYKTLPKNIEEIPTMINVNNLIILYHLVSKHKVKGINKQFYAYLTLLTKIGERIKLFNAYNVWVQRLSNDFQMWGGSLSIDEESIKATPLDTNPQEIDA